MLPSNCVSLAYDNIIYYSITLFEILQVSNLNGILEFSFPIDTGRGIYPKDNMKRTTANGKGDPK